MFSRRFFAYAAVGAVGTLTQYLVLIVVVHTGAATPAVGSMAGAVLGAVINYWLNHRVTFRATSSHLTTLPKFAAIACLGVLVNGLVMKVLAENHHVNYLLAQMVASGLVLILTYLINSVWTFRPQQTRTGARL
ncbi:GtrA family protein [Paraburkholderia sp. BCC1884]|uniref:GtrA family protein n=1 Tax=Paraburkholderia sp. BCC1884 TaxID=2562668 RepID=UPI001182C0B0|nr:GtrA family protein [Paraburkholderia sp. BCC1884]